MRDEEKECGVPDVSVVIPVHGRRPALKRAVESVLAQGGVTVEIVLVDDGSAEDAFAVLGPLAMSPQIRLVRHPHNRGVSAARNTGCREARGTYVAFLDSDDEWRPGKLAAQWAAVRAVAYPDNAFCVTQSLRLLPNGKAEIRPGRPLHAGERPGDYVYVQGAMAQTSSFLLSRPLALAHPFREELSQFEDHLFFIEVLEAGADYAFVGDALSIYHDEHSDGRLSGAKSIRQCDLYEAAVTPLLSARALRAFRARYRARLLFDEAPGEALRFALAAFLTGALRPRYFAGFLKAWLAAMRRRR